MWGVVCDMYLECWPIRMKRSGSGISCFACRLPPSPPPRPYHRRHQPRATANRPNQTCSNQAHSTDHGCENKGREMRETAAIHHGCENKGKGGEMRETAVNQ